jgi:general secretion pathway protein M
MNQLKVLLGNIQSRFESLSSRERRLVLLAGGATFVFALFMTVMGISGAATATQRRTAEKLSKLLDVETLATGFHESEMRRQAVERQLGNNGIKLISYVEEKGTKAGLDIQTMNPRAEVPIGDGKILESGVEITLTDVNLRKLVEFLNTVEVGGLVKVKSLRLEPRVANETLTAWITVATYRLKQ